MDLTRFAVGRDNLPQHYFICSWEVIGIRETKGFRIRQTWASKPTAFSFFFNAISFKDLHILEGQVQATRHQQEVFPWSPCPDCRLCPPAEQVLDLWPTWWSELPKASCWSWMTQIPEMELPGWFQRGWPSQKPSSLT